jgi:hypothetical protein
VLAGGAKSCRVDLDRYLAAEQLHQYANAVRGAQTAVEDGVDHGERPTLDHHALSTLEARTCMSSTCFDDTLTHVLEDGGVDERRPAILLEHSFHAWRPAHELPPRESLREAEEYVTGKDPTPA